ncbi:M14 family metallopeptidase [Psychrosphaera aestuarii]|uniref:M14 family metallopeptidase n=1 Tax=Psychrosphaera aestuarii TaxID=1266052 RepID=UPI001B3255D6|nr:M14 family metallopeptidase [Psychrosphaera aestuarii]
MFFKSFKLTCIFTLIASPLINAEPLAPMWPNTEYKKDIPTVKQVLGYSIGQRISSHSDMLRYFDALANATPNRIKVHQYGTTWEGRKLIYAAIGKPEHLADLEQFASDMQKLSDGQANNSLIKQTPGSVWLGYSVHGNEISGTDSAMMTAYHLLAAKNDATVNSILDNTLVFIDPLQNPDGRTRFTSRYYATVGLEHSSDRLSAEHNEPWPSGRSNHYLFDMNRDWLAITQPETKGRIAMMNKYRPLVVIDLHEMGGDQSYYFAPAAKPINPHMTKTQVNNMGEIGKNIGRHFDQEGFDYFTREIFDAFYPGYGDSWPTFYGASASTYEVSSSRGELFKKRDGEIMTYRNTVRRHFVASIATLEGASLNREKLLTDYVDYQKSAIEQGKKDKKARFYIFSEQKNRSGSHKLATLMAEHDVQVQVALDNFDVCGKSFPAGSYFIDSAQPKGRFVKTTFEQQVNMSPEFVAEQERLRARKLDNEIYDVTGWSLPLMFGVNVEKCGKTPNVKTTLLAEDAPLVANITNPDGKVGFIVPWGDMAAGRFLTAALRKGLSIKSADQAFILENGKTFPAGSLIIERRKNNQDLNDIVAKIASATGAIVHGVDTSWVTSGPSFGSGKTPKMVAPNIAIAWDSPVSSLSTGHTRFVIEREFNYPVTAIRTSMLSWANLDNYQVLILPNGYYHSVLGKAGANNIKQWVKRGGVLITLSGATRFAADPEIGLLDVQRELAVKESESLYPDADDKPDAMVNGVLLTSKKELIESAENNKESPDFVAGVLANVEVDQEHWLTAGVKSNVVGLAYGNDIFTPIKLASGKNIAWFADADNVLASGYLWAENKKQLAYKPFLIHQPMGNGMVIGYTQEPTSRAYLEGLNVLFLNSIFRSAAHARPLR